MWGDKKPANPAKPAGNTIGLNAVNEVEVARATSTEDAIKSTDPAPTEPRPSDVKPRGESPGTVPLALTLLTSPEFELDPLKLLVNISN